MSLGNDQGVSYVEWFRGHKSDDLVVLDDARGRLAVRNFTENALFIGQACDSISFFLIDASGSGPMFRSSYLSKGLLLGLSFYAVK